MQKEINLDIENEYIKSLTIQTNYLKNDNSLVLRILTETFDEEEKIFVKLFDGENLLGDVTGKNVDIKINSFESSKKFTLQFDVEKNNKIISSFKKSLSFEI
ncbi:MAG: hypothetical protein SOZ89_02750 [Peptoniphilaceae bacterium]|nr:hypothetical protein [Peptoniphilaceae bacterium]MDD7383882.1 hypothetical protein [Peptoniphilaceae bacterium]MDY3738023.1 hypothetical protein [Peptoniphilaceae bacterium]